MPYFRWKGIDLQGATRIGRSCAASASDLDTRLLHDDIALLESKQIAPHLFARPASMDVKIQFFRSLATLLESGVLMPDALELVAHQVKHIDFHEVLYALKRDVEMGILLSDSMAKHRHMFNPLMIEMVHIGYETGSLVTSLHRLASYLETMQEFRKKVRMALTMPLITFIFFVVIAAVLVVCVVPQFEALFTSLKQPLPFSTKLILNINKYIRAYGLCIIGLMMGIVALCVWLYRVHMRMRYAVDRVQLLIPLFGPLTVTRIWAQISQALALLLEGGITVVQAFSIATSLVDNVVIRDLLIQVKRDIEAGTQVSDALTRHASRYLGIEAIALVRVGETSATLGPMFAAAARRYQDSIAYTLAWLLNLMQPLVIIFLGILITGLIMAIYLPIMSISWAL